MKKTNNIEKRMKKCLIISCLVVFALVVLTSCSRGNPSEGMPGIDISLAEYNTKVILELYPGTSNSITNDDSPTFILRNQTGNSIIFPNDFGIKIFEKQPQGWIPVENNFDYGGGDIVLQTSVDNPGGLIVDAAPFIPDLKNRAIVRILVVGHVQDRPGEIVGAYIDMEMHP